METHLKDLYIYGAGGLGRETIQLIENEKKWNIKGFLDDNKQLMNKVIDNIKIIGTSEKAEELPDDSYIALCIANPSIKKSIVNKFKNFNWATLISPTIFRARNSEIGNGSIIYHNNIISVDTKIGKFVYINFNSIIPHDNIIGDYVSIMNSVTLSGAVHIGEGTLIGSNAVIIQGIKIGKNVIIGAGAVVVKDIPDNAVVVGNPGRILRYNK